MDSTEPTDGAATLEIDEPRVETPPSDQEASGAPESARSQPCSDLPLGRRIEAILLCSSRPLRDERLAALLGMADVRAAPELKPDAPAGTPPEKRRRRVRDVDAEALQAISEAIDELNAEYEQTGRAYRVETVAGGRQILTLPEFGPLVDRIKGEQGHGRLSPAALETLAIIAYRQPILRAEVENIRGVACGEVLRTLMDRRLVRITGRAEELGRPMLYGTTREFLSVFGLAGLDDLPKAAEA